MLKPINKQLSGGYIALITTILMSVSLLAFVITISNEAYTSRLAVLNSLHKLQSDYLADTCLQIALLKLTQNHAYMGQETIVVNTQHCTIHRLTRGQFPSDHVISVTAIVGAAHTHRQITIDQNQLPDVVIVE